MLEKWCGETDKVQPQTVLAICKQQDYTRPNIPDLFVDEDTPTGRNATTSSYKEIANVLNQYFASVFTKEDALYGKVMPDRTEYKLIDIDVNEEMVK